MNCVIYGEEKMLMEQKLAALKKQYRIHEEDMNVITYWCHETSISEMIEDALTPPFLKRIQQPSLLFIMIKRTLMKEKRLLRS